MLRRDVANDERTARIREDNQPNLSVISISQPQYGVHMLSTKNSRGVENRLSNFICTIWESEEIADARPNLLHVRPLIRDVFSIEIRDITNNVFSKCILAADFPSLPTGFGRTERRSDDAHIAEMTICSVKPKTAMVSFRRPLVPEFNIIVAVELPL